MSTVGWVRYARSKSIEQHVALIKEMSDKSVRDPELRQLAVKIVSGSVVWKRNPRTGKDEGYIKAWDKFFVAPPDETCPPRDDECEIVRIWNFVVRNFRYVYDPAAIDTFASGKMSLDAGGGDCFPVDTLVLRDDGRMVPISTIQVGDRVHDGQTFVDVLKTWDRGLKDIVHIGLNNGATLALSDQHKVLRVPRGDYTNPNTGKVLRGKSPGKLGTEQECRVEELVLGDDLLQPREFGGGSVELSPDDAYLVGAYLAEGCKYGKKRDSEGAWKRDYVSMAGVANSKMLRERVMAILQARGVHFLEYERELRFNLSDVPVLAELDLGTTALDKHLPHLDWGPQTVVNIVAAMEQGDGGVATNGANVVYSTVSAELALQYRVLKRMLGQSTHTKSLKEHGGFGDNAIHRVTVRVSDKQRPWAQIQSLAFASEQGACVDIMTSSGRVYLPESDVVVRQCDDAQILFTALLKAIGFTMRARVIATSDEPNNWVHIYPLVGLPKDNPKRWLPLDCTVTKFRPGDEWHDIAKHIDFEMG